MKLCLACGSTGVGDDWVCAACGAQPEMIEGFPAFAPSLAAENPGFRADYFAAIDEVEAGNFWFRSRNELIVWALTKHVPDCRSFFEIGCGTGFVLRAIHDAAPSIELSGSEIFSAGLEFAARRLPAAQFYQMDARAIPFRDAFDAIGAFDVLEHIEDDETVMAEVAAALRPGGAFLITAPQHPALWSRQDEHAFHIRRYTAREIRRKLEAAGFEVVRMTSFVSLLLPMLVASRLRLRRGGPDEAFDAIDALRQPRAVNMSLGAVMTAERALIRGGLSFPAGGSLLLVCRKKLQHRDVR